MIDLHNHILPGIDDGASDLEQTRNMAREFVRAGVRELAATPHIWPGRFDNHEDRIRELCAQIQADLHARDIPLTLRPGAEYYWHDSLLEKLQKPETLLTLADRGRHLLVEFDNRTRPLGLRETLFEMKLKGLTPVMAHPERYAWVAEDLDFVEELVSGGMLLQGTLARMLGFFGSGPRKNLKTLLERDLIQLVSSDAHVHSQIPQCYSTGVARLTDWVGEARAHRLLSEAPARIFAGEQP